MTLEVGARNSFSSQVVAGNPPAVSTDPASTSTIEGVVRTFAEFSLREADLRVQAEVSMLTLMGELSRNHQLQAEQNSILNRRVVVLEEENRVSGAVHARELQALQGINQALQGRIQELEQQLNRIQTESAAEIQVRLTAAQSREIIVRSRSHYVD